MKTLYKIVVILFILLPACGYGQFTVSGRVLNQADTKPVANASVFISNTTIGEKTAADGTVILHNLKPGKYDLVISCIGFDTYNQPVTVNKNISLGDVTIFPKSIALNEVKIKPRNDVYRDIYLSWFRDEFLGTSQRAADCKIINPEVLNLDYDGSTHQLTGSSYDYLVIENDALGYRLKYLLTDFELDKDHKIVRYKGPVQFEELKGSTGQQRRWVRNREQVYENSPMHFLRSAINNRLYQEDFRVQKILLYNNPNRPPDSVINAKIKFYHEAKKRNTYLNDPEAEWVALLKLPKKLEKTLTLQAKDFIKLTTRHGMYALMGDSGKMFVAYSKNHRYHVHNSLDYINNFNNDETTLIKFNEPSAFFYSDGVITNPYSVIYSGVWGKNRVADLLPTNYEPPHGAKASGGLLAETDYTAKVDTFLSRHVNEETYLQFDKPYYATGDTIYFKAYVTTGEKHQLSDLSSVLHVDLVNTRDKIEKSIKLPLTDGVAWGDFALPDSLPKGNYCVRAYTQLMFNDANAALFERVIPVGSALYNKVPKSMAGRQVEAKPAIQFFPEGGSLVTGVIAKIAFKAEGPNGTGVVLKGAVIDNDGKEVCTFASLHAGMGYFYLSPREGKTYKAKLTYPGGLQDIIDLPAPVVNGISLSVNNDSIPKASVRIQAGPAYFALNKGKDFTLVIYNAGTINTLTCKLDSPLVKLDILKRRWHTGVTTVTLFSPQGEPLCERLFFVQNYEQLTLNVNTDKHAYSARQKVNIKLDARTRADAPSTGHFSVSVTDESKVPVNESAEHTILTDLLLTSGLKGYIENPNYYFSSITPKTQSDLDLVMLTHGYRRFTWRQMLNDKLLAADTTNHAEKGLEITGRAKIPLGKPLANGTISLISTKGGAVLSTITDQQGNFRFSNLQFTDSAKFVLQATNSKGLSNAMITYNKDKPEPLPARSVLYNDSLNQPTFAYMRNNLNQHEQAITFGKANGIMLKKVNIRQSKKHIIDDTYSSSNLTGPGHADLVIHRQEIEHLGGMLTERINGLKGISANDATGNVSYHQTRMSMVVDGVLMRDSNINQYNPSDVETLEFLTGANAAIYGMAAGGGIIVITTRHGGDTDIKDIHAVGVLPITVNGFYKAREFYSPKYEYSDGNIKISDLRSTIYWQPELLTDKDGIASFEYYNADGTGNYRVVIEGIDENGNLGRQVYRYKVE